MNDTKDHVSGATPKVSNVRLVNGRIVAPTLADPEVKKEVKAAMAVHRKSKAALMQYYIDEGVLTEEGHMTEAYGGV